MTCVSLTSRGSTDSGAAEPAGEGKRRSGAPWGLGRSGEALPSFRFAQSQEGLITKNCLCGLSILLGARSASAAPFFLLWVPCVLTLDLSALHVFSQMECFVISPAMSFP